MRKQYHTIYKHRLITIQAESFRVWLVKVESDNQGELFRLQYVFARSALKWVKRKIDRGEV